MRWVVGALVAALIGAPGAGRAEYAVLGLEDVTLGAGAHVDLGDVGANRGSVRLGRAARVAGAVVGETIRLGPRAGAGTLRCRIVVGPGALACETFAAPVVDPSTLPLVRILPGAAAVRVPRRGRATALGAGAYGDVRVGPEGLLVLAGGDYAVRRLALGRGARLVCAAPCRIGVETRVALAARAGLGPAPALDPSAVELAVESRGTQRGLAAGPRARIEAAVYAPEGQIVLGRAGRHAGTFVGDRIVIGARARIGVRAGD